MNISHLEEIVVVCYTYVLFKLIVIHIFTALKTPPAYFEQSKQLERAKTGDLLKAKIQRRPDRQELERRHILEQVGVMSFFNFPISYSYHLRLLIIFH